ncbi:TPM domain-containing protein [Bifidobacterium sp.]|uniref:TPM domain-containing protein n=1 Tax=Bifidobacterium sp. TaxID=41200 RepID=UPI0025BB4729|nr:TPM domain-containing protein [Bifidobacterium sp.]MCI1224367.1 TPM domain-containing protein [Bifidobacterium sp.]
MVEGLGVFHPFGVSRCDYNWLGALRSLAMLLAAMVAALACMLLPAAGIADEGTPAPEQSQTPNAELTVTDNITDTENLLGNNVGAISDAIAKTHAETGVTVRLLYVSTFGDVSNPEHWAEDVLRSTKPAPNTVMLAVASSDGNLVVVVSSGSDEWLRSKETADELSAAALEPLTKGESPDWSGSAMAMMDRIATLKQTSTASGVSRLGAALMGVGLAALIIGIVVALALRRRQRLRRARHRHARKRGGERLYSKNSDDVVAQGSANIQETFSTSDQAGGHEQFH